MKKITCKWPTTPLYQAYHDHEWGRPIHDDRLQFEHLCLESLQCGLSWLTILNKRETSFEAALITLILRQSLLMVKAISTGLCEPRGCSNLVLKSQQL